MGIIVGQNGVNREVKKITESIAGVNREVKSVWVGVNGVNRKVFSDYLIGDLPVGALINVPENGDLVQYLIVHQGLPSSMYDVSCDGTWLLRRDIFENRNWHSGSSSDFSVSTIKTYLNSTFFDRIDVGIKEAIKQVKIPYWPSSWSTPVVQSGAKGVPCKLFLLSGCEVGWESSGFVPPDGTKLDYFLAGNSNDANNKRLAYLEGHIRFWWLRSPLIGAKNVYVVNSVGSPQIYTGNTASFGVRPAFILPSSIEASSDPGPDSAYTLQF